MCFLSLLAWLIMFIKKMTFVNSSRILVMGRIEDDDHFQKGNGSNNSVYYYKC